MHHLKPLSIFLVRRGGDGDRVLFRYPYSEPPQSSDLSIDPSRSPYALGRRKSGEGGTGGEGANGSEDGNASSSSANRRINEKNLVSFPSSSLANLFATGPQLCSRGEKFELKVDDIRFVGHPISLEIKPGDPAAVAYRYRNNSSSSSSSTGGAAPSASSSAPGNGQWQMFHVVFALSAKTTFSVVKCYHDLSHQLAVGIRYEDRRCGYLENQANLMLRAFDEIGSKRGYEKASPFAMALQVSQLAMDLKKVFIDISQTGLVDIRINNWSEILFCLPQKVHKKINPNLLVEPESIFKCMEQLRPYHALLLLQNERELIEELPLDYNTAVKKVILQASPLKNFRVLAADTDLSKLFVFQIGMQLLYWGKATVIFPLCNSNLYVVSSTVPNHLSPVLLEKFSDQFPGLSLAEFLQTFSLPNSITQALPTVSRKEEYQLLARVIVWALQHHLLVQLHTYISLALTDECDTALPDPLSSSETERRRRTRSQTPSPPPTPTPTPPVTPKRELLLQHQTSLIRKKHRSGGGVSSDITSSATTTSSANQKKIEWPPLRTVCEARTTTTGRTPRLLQQQKSCSDDLLSGFTDRERQAIGKVPAASNLEDLRLFARLAPYFNGRYHLEEIMYHENVRRSQLLQLLDKFRSVIIRHEHEDTNITMYFNASIKSCN